MKEKKLQLPVSSTPLSKEKKYIKLGISKYIHNNKPPKCLTFL